ncbi:hypothetical protein BH11BAC5_BH11BAC5_01110 [soil metagenome]
MKKNLHNIDELFKTALDDHAESPPESVWDAIDKRLDKNKVVDINKKYIQLKRIAIALLVLLLGFGAYTLNHWTKINNATATDSTSNTKERNHSQTNQLPATPDTKNKPVAATVTVDATTTADANTFKLTTSDSNANAVDDELVKSPVTKANESAGSKAFAEKQENEAGGKNPTLKSKAAEEVKANAGNNTATTKNILFKKRRLKTTITDGGFEEGETGKAVATGIRETAVPTVSDASAKDEKLTALQLEPIFYFDPQLLSVAQINKRNDRIGPGKNFLPNGLGLTQRPGKKNVIKNTGALSATLFFAPNISSNLLKEELHDRQPGGGQPPMDHDDRDKIKRGELRQSSFSLGVLLDYNLNKHWSVQSGVAFTSKTIHISPKTIYADKDDQGEIKYRFNCSSGYTFLSSSAVVNPSVGDSLQAFGATNTLQYVSVPLAFKYHYYINKIDLFATAGTAFNMLTKGKIATEIGSVASKEVSTSTTINGLKPNYFSGSIGLGLSYSITRSIALSFMPSYNFALNSSTRDATVKTYPNNLSLAAGIRYKL